VILWAHLGTSAIETGVTNQSTSALVTFVVLGVPAWIRVQPLMQLDTAQSCRGFVCFCLFVCVAVKFQKKSGLTKKH